MADFQEGECQKAKAHRSCGSCEAQPQKLCSVFSAMFYWLKQVIGPSQIHREGSVGGTAERGAGDPSSHVT